ncbi:MAG: ribonuclease Y [Acidobacteria bacterium]|nr:ribonuclease Y [Acidobacteriota bacterium]MCA1610049.1 ribonuclease Y [Acidobacteriota bacterium]
MESTYAIAIAIGLALAGAIGGVAYVTLRKKFAVSQAAAKLEAERVLAEASKTAEGRLREASIEAKENVLAARAEFEKTVAVRRAEIQALEKRVLQKEENLDRKLAAQERREEEYNRKERAVVDSQRKVDDAKVEADRLVDEQKKRLEQISGLTAVDARNQLVRSIENEARVEASGLMRRIEEEAIEQSTQKARHIIGMAIQRLASDTVVEATVSVVELPSDDLKGRIIGREGRNIRALEAATGVDLIIDDTPEAIVISAFEPLRREVARLALEKLIVDGRIHPARIEEIVEKVRSELWEKIRQEGEATALEFGIPDLHPELIKLLGRLKYRTSYGQNVLQHSKEVAWLATNMTAELGGNVEVAKRAGLLHDIGKAIDREMDGTHLELGREVLKKFGESNAVIHGMECHHGDYEPRSLEAVLVNGADALSAARPGARREILETYVKRLEKLEHIADGFKGVQKAFAVQAGRELRIIVEATRVTDDEALWLSRDVAKKIEAELQYPGQIKVTVIRETRSVEYAR